jgi:hypothetical protein
MIMASSENVKDLFKWQTLQQPKLAQLDKMLCKLFTAVWTEGKSMTGTLTTEKTTSFLWWKQDDKQVHILRGLAAKFKKTCSLKRYPNGIPLWLVVHPKYRSKNRSVSVLRSSLFRDVMQCRFVFSYWHFRTTYWSHLQGSSSPRRTWPPWPQKMGLMDCPEMSVANY